MESILNFNIKEIENIFVSNNIKKFKAGEIYRWIYNKFIFNFDLMSNISKFERKWLSENYKIIDIEVTNTKISEIENTIKFLFKTFDNEYVESVLIKSKDRNTICVSSQIGCSLGCKFCATGKLGFIRNLKVSEILSQILIISKYLVEKENKKITNIVYMGMGEPFLNYDNVLKSIYILNNKRGFNLGARHITVSTAGIISGINKLKKERLQIRLAVSLNSPFQNIRERIMPVARKYNLDDLLDSLREYQRIKNKKITFEYVLMHKINTSEKDIIKLKSILKNFIYNLNIIKYNPMYRGDELEPTTKEVNTFKRLLQKYNINYTERLSKGSSIAAGCGQLGLEKKLENITISKLNKKLIK